MVSRCEVCKYNIILDLEMREVHTLVDDGGSLGHLESCASLSINVLITKSNLVNIGDQPRIS